MDIKNSVENKRPELDSRLDGKTFLNYYWLKEELSAFCMENGLPASGSKAELTARIAAFLDGSEAVVTGGMRKKKGAVGEIVPDSVIERDIVCSEKHRAFFRKHIGNSFTFNVTFQKWLRSNAGKTYGDAIEAYREIMRSKKQTETKIDSQFEYNAYIRDFFADNKGKTLKDAIKCWKYKKSIGGHNRYERGDLAVLDNGVE